MQMEDKKQREIDEKLRLEREEQEIELKVRREQDEIRRRQELENELYYPWRYRHREGINVFRDKLLREQLANTVKVPIDKRATAKANIFDDYDETINYALSDNLNTRK